MRRILRNITIGWLLVGAAHARTPAREPMDLRGPAPSRPAVSEPFIETGIPLDADAARWRPPLLRLQDDLAELIELLAPAVVAIETDRSPTAMHDGPPHDPRSWTSTGSGVLIRTDGMILTNQHVLADALAIHVTLHDGRRLRGRHVASDPRADLAVIQVSVEDLQPAELGDVSDVRRGHLVLAMGNPLGLAGDGQAAVSIGIVSAIARPLPGAFGQEEDRYYGDMIQTSAAIHPGHSGGPLFDMQGRVVGILTAISTPAGGSEGIAFAVPIGARTRQVIDRLLEGRSVEYGYIGVEVRSLMHAPVFPSALALQPESGRRPHRLDDVDGVLVATVATDGPADRAGLIQGDAIIAVGGQAIRSADEFIQVIGAIEPGAEVDVEFLRRGQRDTVRVELTRRPVTATTARASISFRGAVLGNVDAAMRHAANLSEHALLVSMVESDSPAGRAGLSPGDIVVQLDGQPLSADSAVRLMQRGDACLLGLANGGSILVPAK